MARAPATLSSSIRLADPGMSQRDQDIYSSAPLRSLLAQETIALVPGLQRCSGTHALMVSAASDDAPPVLPLLGNWTRLTLDRQRYAGDLRARGDEPLPFIDDAFDLVLLRHALEVSVAPQQMLEEAVAMAREGSGQDYEKMPEKWSPVINIGASVLIPESYVADLNIRMSLYRRLADLEEGIDIEGFAAEMIDRFGPLPEEFTNLLDIVAIKQLCRKAGVAKVDAGPKGVVIEFHDNNPPNVPNLMNWIQSKLATVKLRPDQKLAIMREWYTPAQRAKGVMSLMKELAALA